MAEEIKEILDNEEKFNETCKYVFAEADKDGNGFIDADEFAGHMKEVYENIGKEAPSQDDIKAQMKDLDTNNDGKLDETEFKSYVRQMLKMDYEHNSS